MVNYYRKQDEITYVMYSNYIRPSSDYAPVNPKQNQTNKI